MKALSRMSADDMKYLVLQLTDEEAQQLVLKLCATLERRRALIEVEPSVAQFSDTSWVTRLEMDGEPSMISFSVAGAPPL